MNLMQSCRFLVVDDRQHYRPCYSFSEAHAFAIALVMQDRYVIAKVYDPLSDRLTVYSYDNCNDGIKIVYKQLSEY